MSIISKAKGSRTERELLKLFWDNNYWCIRVAGSGSMPLPCPDLLAGKKGKSIAVECKSSKSNRAIISQEQVEELKEFAKGFGAQSWIGVRFDKTAWHFIEPKQLKKGNKHHSISKEFALEKGIHFKEFIKRK